MTLNQRGAKDRRMGGPVEVYFLIRCAECRSQTMYGRIVHMGAKTDAVQNGTHIQGLVCFKFSMPYHYVLWNLNVFF